MRINCTKLIHGALFLALIFLAACGGGGGGSTATGATTYTIGGAVTGLTGSGLVLQNNGGGNLSISANGNFAFATPQASGTTYQVIVLTQPSGQTCTVSSSSGTVSAANVNTVAVTCTTSTNTFTIGGAVTGLTGTGLVLQNNGGDNLAISANGNFAFATPQASGSNYQVTVLTQPSGQTCTVSSSNGIVAANVATVAVACTTPTYTIGGTVTGLTGTVVLWDYACSCDILTITTNGNFVLPTPHPSGYLYWVEVKTQPSGQTCIVTNYLGTVSTANVTNVTVTCVANNYTIGGTISGLTATGLVLQNNGGNNLTVNSGAMAFTFGTALPSGTTYNVTVQTQPTIPVFCTVNSPSGTVAAANVNTVSVICSSLSYTIGGAVTGLTGSGLVLQNNGADYLTAASGVYAFATQLASGSTYNVTVKTQPSTPAQVCTVANATGTATATVNNANVSCVNSYTIGGTITGAAAGIGPILQNNLGDNLFIPAITTSPTSFTFSTPVADGGGYSVTQLIRARAPSQDCGGINITGGSSTVAGSNVTTVSITCVPSLVVPKFAYVTNNTADTISAYSIGGTGALTGVGSPVATGDGPYAVAVDPTGQFAYVANQNSSNVSAYIINATTGALTGIDADGAAANYQATIAAGTYPISVTVHPLGKFAYVANQSSADISVYSINTTTGALSAIDANGATASIQATIATGTLPYAVTIDPLGKFAYVANNDSGDVSAYTINPTSGALTAGTSVAAGTNPRSVAIDPTGKCALVASAGSDNIKSYMIDSVTGALTPVSTIATGVAPRSVAIDPNTGLYAYVANAGSSDVSAYSITLSTCAIASIDTDTATVGIQPSIAAWSVPFSVNVDPSGQFVYVANFGSNNISVYGIAVGSGALTWVQTQPTGSGPTSVTTTQ